MKKTLFMALGPCMNAHTCTHTYTTYTHTAYTHKKTRGRVAGMGSQKMQRRIRPAITGFEKECSGF